MNPIRIGGNTIDAAAPPILIAGPCVIEGEAETLRLLRLQGELREGQPHRRCELSRAGNR